VRRTPQTITPRRQPTCVGVCVFAVKHERIKFLAVALRDSIEVYAWAPKPYNKFMSFKVRRLTCAPVEYL